MSNESYLIVSYFAAAGAGVGLAILSVLVLAEPVKKALAAGTALARLVRRALPPWLVLVVLMGFLSVTYFDCDHDTYQKIVADRHHLVNKTFEQGSEMTKYLAVALLVYGLVLGIGLWARARQDGTSTPAK